MGNSPLQVELLPSLHPAAPHPLLFVSLFFLWASLPVHLWIKLPVSFSLRSHCPLKPLCSRLLSLKHNKMSTSCVRTQTAALQLNAYNHINTQPYKFGFARGAKCDLPNFVDENSFCDTECCISWQNAATF